MYNIQTCNDMWWWYCNENQIAKHQGPRTHQKSTTIINRSPKPLCRSTTISQAADRVWFERMRGRFCQGTQCHFPLDPRYVRSNHGIVGQEVGWDLRVCHHSPRWDAAPGHSGSHSASHTGLTHTQCCKALRHNQTTVPLPTRLPVRAATSWGPAPTCYPAHMLQLQHWRRPHRAKVVDLAFETEGLRKRNLLTDGSNPWHPVALFLHRVSDHSRTHSVLAPTSSKQEMLPPEILSTYQICLIFTNLSAMCAIIGSDTRPCLVHIAMPGLFRRHSWWHCNLKSIIPWALLLQPWL